MSLFKERAASAKKVIALQNEIIALKNSLTKLKDGVDSSIKNELEALKQEHSQCLTEINNQKELVLALKAELKKVKSENTRTKKKLLAAQEAAQVAASVDNSSQSDDLEEK